jgi:integrase
MKKISEGIYQHGKRGNHSVRLRIPAALRSVYPAKQTHIRRNLRTGDASLAKSRGRVVIGCIEAEFTDKRQKLELTRASQTPKRVTALSDEQIKAVAEYWAHNVLAQDEARRQKGLEEEEFQTLGQQLGAQREELGALLARGKTAAIFPALHSFLYMCGVDFVPEPAEAQRASFTFLRAVVETLEKQIIRQSGGVLDSRTAAPEAVHPLPGIAPERAARPAAGPTWEKIFGVWRDYVVNRQKSTVIAYQTPWRDLMRFSESRAVPSPAGVTKELMAEFASDMKGRGLAVNTINERLTKIRSIYKIGVGKLELANNPAVITLGYKENSVQQRHKRRLAFDRADLMLIFGSDIYLNHLRSQGQSGEASYWLALLMYYTGARPEELAGLALVDILEDARWGWYFNIIDRPTSEDDLFDEEIVPNSHRRTLKNGSSVRRVPVARQLIDLGLLNYVEWVRAQGASVVFPTLRKDWHGKLCGAFSKFFGRHLRSLGITDERKVLYSFRHNMKDFMEKAEIPSKYLQRLLGHTTGDGPTTDGYGSEQLPFKHTARYFKRIKFPAIPALPWQPGQGTVRRPKRREKSQSKASVNSQEASGAATNSHP